MKIKWHDILFDFYCLGCIVLIFLALLGYNSFFWALIYGGFTLLYLMVAAIILLFKKFKKAEAHGALKTVVFCPVCKKCLPITPANQAPEYVNGKKKPRDDYEDFMRRHDGCRALIRLSILMGPWRKKGKLICEPIKNELFLAKRKGGGLFLINRARFDINEPLQYEASPLWCRKSFTYCLKWIF